MNVEEKPDSPDSEDSEPDLKQYFRLVCETRGKCAETCGPPYGCRSRPSLFLRSRLPF
jgi:hypothetical protein